MPGTKRVWIALVAGGRASGKRTVCSDLEKSLHALAKDRKTLTLQVRRVHMDDYRIPGLDKQTYYSPQAFDFDQVRVALETPPVSKSPSPVPGSENTDPPDENNSAVVVLVDGAYALYDPDIRSTAIMKLFIDCDADTRLSRWILRDIGDDPSQLEPLLDDYLAFERPEMENFIYPTRKFADVILPRGSEESSINLVAAGIYDRIQEELVRDTEPIDRRLLELPLDGSETPIVNLRRESFEFQSGRFHDLA